jgi:hypothetical protein
MQAIEARSSTEPPKVSHDPSETADTSSPVRPSRRYLTSRGPRDEERPGRCRRTRSYPLSRPDAFAWVAPPQHSGRAVGPSLRNTIGPGPVWGPARSITSRLASTSASDEASSGRPAGVREVGELVGFCRSPGERAGRWPRPARDGSAASHLEGLMLFVQAGPPPFSRAAHGAADRAGRQQRRRSLPPPVAAQSPSVRIGGLTCSGGERRLAPNGLPRIACAG